MQMNGQVQCKRGGGHVELPDDEQVSVTRALGFDFAGSEGEVADCGWYRKQGQVLLQGSYLA
ncbi:hypothetical protein PSCICM_15530 [Pseudomonas cichorii]|nr:hypothetical protein PSCICM_15530 [Pseudomonas cichorii]